MSRTDSPARGTLSPDLELDRIVSAFEQSYYARGGSSDLAEYLPPPGQPHRTTVLVELARVDLEFAWARGEERGAGHYLRRFPELAANSLAVRALGEEEARLRRQQANRVGADGPATVHTPDVPILSIDNRESGPRPSHRTGGRADGPLPELGELVAGFRLTAELGRGAFGRVYLACQSDLADRQVALKLSAKFPGESAVLARLQHANIVPVYSVHRHARYHAICMPYLGATTLADLIRDFHGTGTTAPTSGRQVASTLGLRAARTLPGEPAAETELPRAFPPAIREVYARMSFVELVLWIGAELADGLAHAHDRGVLHRDVKPANVLLTDEGRPMLLDFNLAVTDGADPREVGGTVQYMAPEGLDALLGGTSTPADARADVYALGLVLCELMTGRLPFGAVPAGTGNVVAAIRDARRKGPTELSIGAEMTPAVVSIIRTALAADPKDRYPTAAALRDDLRRQLDSRPLAFAPEPSRRERLHKWAHRHPRASSWMTVTSLALLLLTVVVVGFLLRQSRYATFRADANLAKLADDRRAIRGLLADRGSAATELEEAAARSRTALSDYPPPDSPEWDDHPLVRPLTHDRKAELRQAQTDVLYQLSGAEVLLAQRRPDRRTEHLAAAKSANHAAAVSTDEARRELLRGQRAWIDALERGDSRRLEGAAPSRNEIRRQLDGHYRTAATDAGTGSFWLAAGRLHLAVGETGPARACLKIACELQPTDTWAWYHAGAAALVAKDYPAADVAFTACVATREDVPEAYLNRAVARIGRGEFRAAIADLDHIEPHAARLPRLYFVRATAKRRLGDPTGAERDRKAGLALTPTDATSWSARGEARLESSPPDAAGAVADFEAAVAADPDFPQGYQNLATVLSESLGKSADAVAVLGRAVERFPEYVSARAGRAVLLARLGSRDPARADAEAAVGLDPSAITLYQAGCVYVLTAAGAADERRGFALLRRALRLEPGWAGQMKADADLKAIWKSPVFAQMLAAAAALGTDPPPGR